jgi:hypothetical protein
MCWAAKKLHKVSWVSTSGFSGEVSNFFDIMKKRDPPPPVFLTHVHLSNELGGRLELFLTDHFTEKPPDVGT